MNPAAGGDGGGARPRQTGKLGRFLFFGARQGERGRPTQQTIGGHNAEQRKDRTRSRQTWLFLMSIESSWGSRDDSARRGVIGQLALPCVAGRA